MCGRYVTPDQAAMEREFGLTARQLKAFTAKGFTRNFDTRPTDQVPVLRVIRSVDGDRRLDQLRWWLVPYWAKGKPIAGKPNINATIENLRTNGMFSSAWKRGQRCLVPVSGFFEWQAQPPDWQRTVKVYITVSDQPVFCFAGIWDSSSGPDGTIESTTVITMPANEIMRGIHNSKKPAKGPRYLLPETERRMPAILRKEDWDAWLTGSLEEAWAVLQPYPSGLMVAWPVISNGNNDEGLIQPIDM